MSTFPVVHQDMSAFCQTCPDVQAVTAVLNPLGFRVAFHMDADDQQAYLQLAPLPEQCHYTGPCGMSVVYLAGEDGDLNADEDRDPNTLNAFPAHASRFWFYCGAESKDVFQHTLDTLATAFSLSWEPPVANVSAFPSTVVPSDLQAVA